MAAQTVRRGTGSMMRRYGCPRSWLRRPNSLCPRPRIRLRFRETPPRQVSADGPSRTRDSEPVQVFWGQGPWGLKGDGPAPRARSKRGRGMKDPCLQLWLGAPQRAISRYLRTTRVGAPSPALSCYQVGAGSRESSLPSLQGRELPPEPVLTSHLHPTTLQSLT